MHTLYMYVRTTECWHLLPNCIPHSSLTSTPSTPLPPPPTQPPSAPQGLQWSMSCPLVNLTWDPLPADQLVTVYEVNITLLSGDGEAQTFRTNQTYLEVALSPSTDCAVVVRGFAGLIAGDVSETLMFSKGICREWYLLASMPNPSHCERVHVSTWDMPSWSWRCI